MGFKADQCGGAKYSLHDIESNCWLQLKTGKLYTLYFAGDIRKSNPAYSHGVRQTIVGLFQNNTGFAPPCPQLIPSPLHNATFLDQTTWREDLKLKQ